LCAPLDPVAAEGSQRGGDARVAQRAMQGCNTSCEEVDSPSEKRFPSL
jgi:hypothetical protein